MNVSPSYPEAIGARHVYKEVGDRALEIYVVSPTTPSPTPVPGIVFFHGGGWAKGAPSLFNDQAAYFTSQGLASFLVEYRLLDPEKCDSPEICIRDAKSAMRWVRSNAVHFGVNPLRLAAAGGSAGGHLAICCALVRDFDEPSDDLSVSTEPQALLLFNPVVEICPGRFGYRRVGERYKEFSPISHVGGKTAPPTLILSGSADRTVPAESVRAFQEAMQKSSARCEVRIYEGQEHGFYRRSVSQEYYEITLCETRAFLESLGWMDSAK